MQTKAKAIIWIVIVLVVLGLIVIGLSIMKGDNKTANKGSSTNENTQNDEFSSVVNNEILDDNDNIDLGDLI